MEKEKKCPICRGQTFCNCENKKFIADIVFHFSGKDKEEVTKRLKDFRANVQDLNGASMASFPGQVHENRYDKEVMDKIVDKFVSLVVNYNYTDDEIEEELANLKGRIDEEVTQYYNESQAEAAYERHKEDEFFKNKAKGGKEK